MILYLQPRRQALSSSNIQSGFKATDIFPLDSNQILSRLQIKSNDKPINKSIDKPVNTPVNNPALQAPMKIQKFSGPRIIQTNSQFTLNDFFNVIHKIQTRQAYKLSISLSKTMKWLCIILSFSLMKTTIMIRKLMIKTKERIKLYICR